MLQFFLEIKCIVTLAAKTLVFQAHGDIERWFVACNQFRVVWSEYFHRVKCYTLAQVQTLAQGSFCFWVRCMAAIYFEVCKFNYKFNLQITQDTYVLFMAPLSPFNLINILTWYICWWFWVHGRFWGPKWRNCWIGRFW